MEELEKEEPISDNPADVIDEDPREHLNIVFIGHVGKWNKLQVSFCFNP